MNLPAHLQARQSKRQVAEAAREGLGSSAPPRVSIKGGAFTLIDGNGEQKPIATNYLDCVIIDTAAPSRIYWGGKPYDPNAPANLAPDCFSDNGIGASANALHPQSTRCNTCPQDVWGSAVSKVSGKPVKACGVVKKVAVLAFAHGQNGADGVYSGNYAAEFPFLLSVPVMSHDNLKVYSDKFKNQPFDVSDVVTRISFVHGAVGVLDFNAAGFIDADTDGLVEDVLGAKMTDALVGRGDQPVQGQLPAPGQQSSGPTAAEQARHDKDVAEVVQRLAPDATPAPAPFANSAPAPAAPKRAGRPRKTPATEPAASPFGGPPEANVAPVRAPFAQPAQQPVAPFAAPQQPASHGIVANAPAPSADMEKALNLIFSMPT